MLVRSPTNSGGGGGGVLTYKMGMYVPPMLKRSGLTELIKLKKWVLSELKEG